MVSITMKGKRQNKITGIVCWLCILCIVYMLNPYKLEYTGYQPKIWAHKVNTISKLKYTEKFYSGIELDLVYNPTHHLLEVNHPPDLPIGLDLGTYFSEIDDKQLKLWLDIKNLSPENAVEAAEELNRITEKYSMVKQNIMVESPEIQYLPYFKQLGFRTSFYLPLLFNDQKELISPRIIDSVKNLLKQFPSDGISCHANNYFLLKEYFKKERKYLWDFYKPYDLHQIRNYRNFREYVSDPTVDAVLIEVALPIGKR